MAFSLKAVCFVVILVLSISMSSLVFAQSDDINRNKTVLDVSYVVQHLDSLYGKKITVTGNYLFRHPYFVENCGWTPVPAPDKSATNYDPSTYFSNPWVNNYLIEYTSGLNYSILELTSENSNYSIPVPVPGPNQPLTVTGKLERQYIQDNCGPSGPTILKSAYLAIEPQKTDNKKENSTDKSTIINVSEDTYTHFTPPFDNQSFNGQGLIAKYHFDYYGGKDNRKTWLKFDLPIDLSKITHAILRMYLTGVEAQGSLVDVYRDNYTNWSETNMTYDNEPAHFAALSAGPFAEQSLNATNKYYEWDVTNAITSNPNGKTVTLVLVGNSLNNGASFDDKESGMPPQLVITRHKDH